MDNFLLQSKTAVTWSTEGISRRERFDYWSDVVCQGICKLECRRFANTPFYGKLTYARFGEIDLLEMESDPEIFSELNQMYGDQIVKMVIRDVRGVQQEDPGRLEGMEVIPVN